jgi:hypothetical protein
MREGTRLASELADAVCSTWKVRLLGIPIRKTRILKPPVCPLTVSRGGKCMSRSACALCHVRMSVTLAVSCLSRCRGAAELVVCEL